MFERRGARHMRNAARPRHAECAQEIERARVARSLLASSPILISSRQPATAVAMQNSERRRLPPFNAMSRMFVEHNQQRQPVLLPRHAFLHSIATFTSADESQHAAYAALFAELIRWR